MSTLTAPPPGAPDAPARETGSVRTSKAGRYFLIGLAALFSLAAVRVITGVNEVDSQGSLRADHGDLPDPARRPRRPVERALRRGEHRARGPDAARHLGRRVLHLLLRPVGR